MEEKAQRLGIMFMALFLSLAIFLVFETYSLGIMRWSEISSMLVRARESPPIIRVEERTIFNWRAELISPFRWGEKLSAPLDFPRLI